MVYRQSERRFFLLKIAGCFLINLFLTGHGYAQSNARGADLQEEHPRLTPSGDATIDYEFLPKPPANMTEAEKAAVPIPTERYVQLLFSGDGGLMRIRYLTDKAGDSERGSVIMNRSAQEVIITLDAQKIYTRLVQQETIRNPFFLDLSMKFVRKGKDEIAGQPCTVWSVVSPQGQSSVCVTDSGFILDYEGVDVDGLNGHLKATKVSYVPVPASAFEPPAGFREFVPHKKDGEITGPGDAEESQSSSGAASDRGSVVTGVGPGLQTGDESQSGTGEREAK